MKGDNVVVTGYAHMNGGLEEGDQASVARVRESGEALEWELIQI